MTRKEIKEFGQHMADKLFHKREQNNIIYVKGWLARDKSLNIYVYKNKPTKKHNEWDGDVDWNIRLNLDYFPQVKWDDNEPTPCEILIKIEK